MDEDILSKTGESIYQKNTMALDEVTFDGNDGIFLERAKDAKKDKETGIMPRTKLTQPEEVLEVVYLKIRRTLFHYDEMQEKFWNTSEHNSKSDLVVLYKDGKKEIGTAEDLRAKYLDANQVPILSTQQVVYAYVPKLDKVVRLLIKGASLGSRFEHKTEVLKFYDYFRSFGKGEHSHQFVTKLTPVKEINKMKKTYFAISFVKGQPLDEEMQSKVLGMINETHEMVQAIDDRLQATLSKSEFSSPKQTFREKVSMDDIPIIEEGKETYGTQVEFPKDEGEIDPKDIPF